MLVRTLCLVPAICAISAWHKLACPRLGVGMALCVQCLHASGWHLVQARVAVISRHPACDVGGRVCRSWAGVPALSTGNTIACHVRTLLWLFLVRPTHPPSLAGWRGKPQLLPFMSPGTWWLLWQHSVALPNCFWRSWIFGFPNTGSLLPVVGLLLLLRT